MLSDDDAARITAAIAAAEARTAGEIVCTLAADRHRYFQWILALAALAAFLLPALLTFAGLGPMRWLSLVHGWQAGPVTEWRMVAVYATLQGGILLLATAILWWSPFAQDWVPRAIRRDHIHDAALRQFLARGVDRTRGRTGILIYVSLHDRIAEVVTDRAVHAVVPADAWEETVRLLADGMHRGAVADGFVAAIEAAGAILATHFPPAPEKPNELPNHLVLL